MSAVLPLRRLLGSAFPALSKYEAILLEVELFTRICDELKEFFIGSEKRSVNIYYISAEGIAMEARLVRSLMSDILATDEYNLKGIACYTDTHEDVVLDIFAGINANPTATFFRRLVDLHRSVRRELYEMIVKKIFQQTEPESA